MDFDLNGMVLLSDNAASRKKSELSNSNHIFYVMIVNICFVYFKACRNEQFLSFAVLVVCAGNQLENGRKV